MSALLKKSLLLQEIPVTGDAKMPLKTLPKIWGSGGVW